MMQSHLGDPLTKARAVICDLANQSDADILQACEVIMVQSENCDEIEKANDLTALINGEIE